MGQLLVTFSAWLFALSTIISWCYYGESGIVWLGGPKLVPLYRLFYSGLVLLATMPFIGVSEIDTLSVFGNGMMIWGNIPIMLIFPPTLCGPLPTTSGGCGRVNSTRTESFLIYARTPSTKSATPAPGSWPSYIVCSSSQAWTCARNA